MKSFWVAVFALLVVHLTIHRGSRPQRTPAQQKAWADWFAIHSNGGGV